MKPKSTVTNCNPRIIFVVISMIYIIVGILYMISSYRITELPAEYIWVMIFTTCILILYIWLLSFILNLICKSNYYTVAWVFAIISLISITAPIEIPELEPYRRKSSNNGTMITESLIPRIKKK